MTSTTASTLTSLNTHHLKDILDAIRYGQPMPDTPLKQLTAVQCLLGQIEPMGEQIASDVALVDLLISTIHQELWFHRQHYGLAAPNVLSSRPQALMALQRDFQQQNVELEAWSLLYFRYVRTDLALGLEGVADMVGQTARNLRRRQTHGLHRLLYYLIRQELRATAF